MAVSRLALALLLASLLAAGCGSGPEASSASEPATSASSTPAAGKPSDSATAEDPMKSDRNGADMPGAK